MNKKEFLESLQEIYCRLGVTKTGVGVVAIRRIPKGTDPFKNCDPFGDVLEIPEKEFEAFAAPEEAKRLVRDFCPVQNGIFYVPDYGMDALPKCYYMNHSDSPTMITTDDGVTFVAARDIEPGEELTANYDDFDETNSFTRL